MRICDGCGARIIGEPISGVEGDYCSEGCYGAGLESAHVGRSPDEQDDRDDSPCEFSDTPRGRAALDRCARLAYEFDRDF